MSRVRIGLDIGGSGVKAALVDVDNGVLLSDRLRVETPEPSTPEAVAAAAAELVSVLDAEGPVGIGFPTVVRDGWISTANNIDKSWIDVNAISVFEEAFGRDVWVINDADAAAIAELAFGSARDVAGTVIMLTFGTGIGSALLTDGELVPNLELGQLELEGHAPAESYYSARARRREDLSWKKWAARANAYIRHVDKVFNPSLIIVGGGVSRKWDEWAHWMDEDLPVVKATLDNNAGIVGAAVLAANG